MGKFNQILSLLFVLLFFALKTHAQNEQVRIHYIGTNPLALAAAFPLKEELKRYLPIVAGNEYGLSVVGGYFYKPHQSLEARLALGNIHQVSFVGQVHVGTNYFFLNRANATGRKGLYVGAYLKYWDYYNRLTKVHFHHISPQGSVGFWREKKRFYTDLRLSQTVVVHSWSNLEHSRSGTAWFLSPWPKFIPVLPTLAVSVGLKL